MSAMYFLNKQDVDATYITQFVHSTKAQEAIIDMRNEVSRVARQLNQNGQKPKKKRILMSA